MDEILRIRNLNVSFDTFDGQAKALRHVDLDVKESEAVGLVGETGSGKTVLCLSVLRLVPLPGRIVADEIRFRDKNLLALSEGEMDTLRGAAISMIPQSPMTALNPIIKVRRQMADVIRRHHGASRCEAEERASDLLTLVGLPDPRVILEKYPYELSGGMCQRVAIAMAVSSNPALLIADEPTTALDVTVQKQIIRLVKSLRIQLQSSLLWISHDLGVIQQMCDRVVILYAGTIVETGSTDHVLGNPLHPYTRSLIEAIPSRRKRGSFLNEIKGSIPNLLAIPEGCVFAPRCDHLTDQCTRGGSPPLREPVPSRKVACLLFAEGNVEQPVAVPERSEETLSRRT
jgi:oligopeptide/dipeptide ABC transporter ATP-binding protein